MQRLIAGPAEGVRGGGRWNYVERTPWQSSSGEHQASRRSSTPSGHLGGILGTFKAPERLDLRAPDVATYPGVDLDKT